MNRIARTLGVVLFGAATSALTAALLIYFEARTGHTLFGYAIATYLPVGAIAAGFLGALGYLAGSLVLRIRPVYIVLPAMVLAAAASVFLAQSGEFSLFLGAKGETKDAATFSQFLVNAMAKSPLRFGFAGASGSNAATPASVPGAAAAAPQGPSDRRVDGISSGVQGMLAAPDVTNSAAAQHMTQIDDGIQSFGKGIESHGDLLIITALQFIGFSFGALVVFVFLRSLAYCEDCGLFLNRKGAQTRYFRNSDGVQNSTNDFLISVKERGLQECIQAHFGVGSSKKDQFCEYSSTIEIRRCTQCQTHRLNFSARRKAGSGWKDMPVLGHTAYSMEPIDVIRA